MTLLMAAVHNNAIWCDAVCRALGCDTALVDGLWVNRSPSPPYYSNAVTLVPDAVDAQLARVRSMLASPLPRPWTIKDGFHVLDLAALGFQISVRGTVGRPRGRRVHRRTGHGCVWSAVTDDAGLAAWEDTWRGPNDDEGLSGLPRLFQPSLLEDPDISFLAGRLGDTTVAVAVANRSDDGSGPVVGISNIVLLGDDPERHRAGIVAATRSAFQGLPMVGYERGDDLRAILTLGFQPLGPLRVWLGPR